MKKLRTGIAVGIMTSLLLTSCSSSDDSEYRIGVISQLSGPLAVFGQAFTAGLDNYVQNVNARGGVNGNTIRVVVGDDRLDPAAAIAAFRRMANSDRVLAVLGLPASNTAAGVQRLADEMETPVIGTAILPPTTDFSFVAGLNGIQALPNELPLIEHLAAERNIARPSISVVSVDSVAGQASSDELRTAAEAKGYSIDGEFFVLPDVAQFSTEAAQINADDPDFVAVLAAPGGLAVIVRALRQAGVDVPIVNAYVGASEPTLAELTDPDLYVYRDYADPAEEVSEEMRNNATAQGLPDGTAFPQGQVYTQGYVMGQLVESVLKECGESCTATSFRDTLETSASQIATNGLTGQAGFSAEDHIFLSQVRYFHWDLDAGRSVPVDGLPIADAVG